MGFSNVCAHVPDGGRVQDPTVDRDLMRDTANTIDSAGRPGPHFRRPKWWVTQYLTIAALTGLGACSDFVSLPVEPVTDSPTFAISSTESITITNLTVASGETYRVITSGLAQSDLTYTDRTFTFGTVPELVRGLTYIRPPNKDRESTGNDSFLRFTIDREAIVYVAYDFPATPPAWLTNNFSNTGVELSVEWPAWSNRFELYERRFPAGEVVLGSNREGDTDAKMYIVIVKPVNDGDGSGNQAPVADAGGPYSGVAGSAVRFDASGSTDSDAHLPLTYAWDFGDGSTGSGVSPSHTYASDGSYAVTLTVTDSTGASSAPDTTTATINNVTASSVVTVTNLTAASGETYRVITTGLSQGDLVYTDRDFTYGTIPDLVQGQTYIRTANKDRESTGNDSFLRFTIDREAIIYIAYDDPVGPAWLMDEFTDTGERIFVELPTRSNAYYLFAKRFPAGEVVLGSNREGDNLVKMYTVIIGPSVNQAPVANPGGPYAGARGTAIGFDGRGSADPDFDVPLSYEWDFGDGSTGTGERPMHTYAEAGTYTVTLVVTDAQGARSTPAMTPAEIREVNSSVTLQVDGGLEYTCALRDNSVVECWGLNEFGQAPAVKFPATGTFTQISAHKKHSCALRDDGVVECWGLNDFGRAPATKSAATGRFTHVGVGGDFSCALRSDAAIECWGGNGFGQRDSIPSGTFTQIAVGDDHICALRSNDVATCWGQLIRKSKSAATGSYTQLSSGDDHTCALRSDGVIECWFLNIHGQAPATKRAASGSFTEVSAGGWHTCALRTDGVIECWGKNDNGEAPATRRAQRGRFVHVGTGYQFTCGLRDDGSFECWGRNNFGQAKSEQRIIFTSNPPNPAIVGNTYRVSVEGGGSGEQVVLSSRTPDVCTVSSRTVTFVAPGTCTIAADQSGNFRYFAAPRATQSFSVTAR